MNPWVGAAIAMSAGVVVGTIASRIVAKVLARSKVDALRESTAPLAGLALSVGVIVGLLAALGFIAPDDLKRLGNDAIAFLPKAIAALVIVIAANVASTFAAAAVARSLAGTGAAARFAPIVTKFGILGGGAIIAAAQTGIDTVVVNIAVASLLSGVALSLALLIGLGGRQVASELAAGRAWRSQLRSGDRIRTIIEGRPGGDDSAQALVGVVVDVHPTAVELDSTGSTIFVPNSRLLGSIVERDRPEPADAEGELEAR